MGTVTQKRDAEDLRLSNELVAYLDVIQDRIQNLRARGLMVSASCDTSAHRIFGHVDVRRGFKNEIVKTVLVTSVQKK